MISMLSSQIYWDKGQSPHLMYCWSWNYLEFRILFFKCFGELREKYVFKLYGSKLFSNVRILVDIKNNIHYMKSFM